MFLEMKMPISEALMTSVVGLGIVIVILAFIAVLIMAISKVIRAIESGTSKNNAATQPVTVAAPSTPAVPMPAGMNQGELEIIGTDEKTAAVVMAIVSNKSGIPLNRLSFKSIRLMEDEK